MKASQPGVTASGGEGQRHGEGRGVDFSPLEASACRPADRPIAPVGGFVNLPPVVCVYCEALVRDGVVQLPPVDGCCDPCAALFRSHGSELLRQLQGLPTFQARPAILEPAFHVGDRVLVAAGDPDLVGLEGTVLAAFDEADGRRCWLRVEGRTYPAKVTEADLVLIFSAGMGLHAHAAPGVTRG